MSAEQYVELERAAVRMLQNHSEYGTAWQFLAIALSAQGKDSRHALSRSVQLMPHDATAHNNLGNSYARAGQFEEAISSYRAALALKPQFLEASRNLAQAHNNFGSALLALGRIDEADATFRSALEIDPEFFEAHNNLGNALRVAGRIEHALASYDRALQIVPSLVETHCNRAIALRLLGRQADSQAACRRALDIEPRYAPVFVLLGELCADGGDFLEAQAFFERAIAMEWETPEAWAGLASLRNMTRDDGDWLMQAQRVAKRPLSARKLAVMEFAIGKYCDDVRDFEQAFMHFRKANEAAKRCRPAHDRRALSIMVDAIIRDHDTRWIHETRRHANDSQRPVFIIGMLRSGTTLAEQILAAHPAVFGAGELSFWGNAFAELGRTQPASPERDRVCERWVSSYAQLLSRCSLDASRVVDKMPTNFAFLGLIHAFFPNARIIHMQRNPLDTCLSIYFQNFDTAITYANDLEDLAHYYEEYLRLVSHWRSSLPPGVMLEVPYEDLVNNPELRSREMLEFIGLSWDDRCLDFHRTKRTIATASKWQVRQKIHRSSVDRWRNYEAYLGPLRRLVKPATAAPSNCE